MNALQLVPTIESRIAEYAEINRQIKTLEAQKEKLKKGLVTDWFVNNQEYRSSKDIVLATYKPEVRIDFKAKEFKLVHPKLYEEFLDIKEIYKFLVK